MSGSPSGGTFSGAGVTGNQFDPTGLSPGDYTITYEVTVDGCTDSDQTTITIKNTPTANAGSYDPLCEDGSPISLSGSPSGGTFSGAGVTGNQFDPTGLSPGDYTITYEVTVDGCTGSDQTTITIKNTPTANAGSYDPLCEDGSPISLSGSPSGGTFSGAGVTGNQFDPTGLSPGDYTITYEVTVDGCTDSDQTTIKINGLSEVSLEPIGPFCEDDETSYDLVGLSTGGFFTGEGVSNGKFTPTDAGVDDWVITYTYTNGDGCTNTTEVTVTVNETPTIEISDIECFEDLLTYSFVISTEPGNLVSCEGADIEENPNGTLTCTLLAGEDAFVVVTDPQTGCTASISVTAPNCNCPTVSPPTSGGDQEICEGETIQPLTASVGGGYVIDWYANSSGGTPLLEGSDEFLPTEEGTYYAVSRDPVNGCISNVRRPVTLTINPLLQITEVDRNCSEDAQNWTLQFTSDADISELAVFPSNRGTIISLGGGLFEVADIDKGQGIQIQAAFEGTGCENTLTVASPVCPEIVVEAFSYCEMDAPYVEYTVSVIGFIPTNDLTIEWTDPNTNAVYETEIDGIYNSGSQTFSGVLLWPGAEVDGQGRGINWPGWNFINGQWVPDPTDGRRQDLDLVFSLNPDETVTVSYPPGDPDCSPDPNLGELGDYVWEDSDEDGVQDNNEPGVEGVKVSLYTCTGSLVTFTTTDEEGAYLFENLQVGDEYYVVFDLSTANSINIPEEWEFTRQNSNTGTEATDSDANPNGRTACITITEAPYLDLDAGVFLNNCGEAPKSEGNVEICANEPIPALTAEVKEGFVIDWYTAPSGGTLLSSASTSFTPPGEGTYYAEARDPINDCVSPSRTPISLIVNPLPELTVSGDISICTGEMVTLEANGDGDINWDTGSTENTIQVSPERTTTYQVALSGMNGCVSTASVTITVLPEPEVNAGFDLTICPGETVTLTASGEGTFLWDGITSGESIVVAPTFNRTYEVELTDANRCTATDRITVFVENPPTLIEGDKICDSDGDGYRVQFTSGVPLEDIRLVPAGRGTISDLGNGLFEISNLSGGLGIRINITDSGTGCSNTLLVSAPECGCETEVSLDLPESVCIADDAFLLEAQTIEPGQLTFTINGVESTVFDPGALGMGTYTVEVAFEADAGGCTDTDQATIIVDEGCLVFPEITHEKTFTGISKEEEIYTATYSIRVINSSPVVGFYNLTDEPAFDDDLLITAASFASQFDPTVSGELDVESGSWVLVNDRSIGPGEEQEYILTIQFQFELSDGVGSESYTPCGANGGEPQAGEGLFNRSFLDTDMDGIADEISEVCGDIPEEFMENNELGDFVWEDTDEDGEQDPDERGVDSVQIKLFLVDPGTTSLPELYAETYTDSTGVYLFTDLPDGTYCVLVCLPEEGYEFTQPFAVVDPELDSDIDPLTGKSENVDLKGGASDRSIDAGLIPEGREICDLSVALTEVVGNDQDTPDLLDDTFTFTLIVNGKDTTASWMANDRLNTMGNYGDQVTFGPYPAVVDTFSLLISDKGDETCTLELRLEVPRKRDLPEGPEVSCPLSNHYCPIIEEDIMLFSTDPFDCTATITLPVPDVKVFCSVSDRFDLMTEVLKIEQEFVLDSTGQVVDTLEVTVLIDTFFSKEERTISSLEKGDYYFRYTVTDLCGAVSVQSCRFRVADQEAPIAICADRANISLGTSGLARAYVRHIDFGSYDNCGIESLEVRRIFEGIDPVSGDSLKAPVYSEWGPYAEFFCTDAPGEIEVQLLVTDSSGNENLCWTKVLIEDKIAPVCIGLEDTLVYCTDLPGDFDPFEPDTLQAYFGLPQVYDNCEAVAIELRPAIEGNEEGECLIIRSFLGQDLSGNISLDTFYQVVTLSGTLRICGICEELEEFVVSGAITTPIGTPVPDVSIHVNGLDPLIGQTDGEGLYYFDRLISGYDYTLTPELDDYHRAGVNTADLVRIYYHLQGLFEFNNGYEYLAADVNNSQDVTIRDLIELRKLILGDYTALPGSPSWRFLSSGQKLWDKHSWLSELEEFVSINNLVRSDQRVDFTAVKVGDVNFSLTQTDLRTSDKLTLDVIDQYIEAGEETVVRISGTDLSNWAAFQFTLNWDQAAVELIDVKVKGDIGMKGVGLSYLSQGMLTVSWFRPLLDAGEAAQTEMELVVRAKVPGHLSDWLRLSSRITEAIAFDQHLQAGEILLNFRDSETSGAEKVPFALNQNVPNPFLNESWISFQMPEQAKGRLSIYNATGALIWTKEQIFEAGYNAIRIDRTVLLETGVYFYTVEAGTYRATRSMVVQE